MIGRIEIIEENASDASRFVSMGDIKVFVAPLLEGKIERARGMSVTGIF